MVDGTSVRAHRHAAGARGQHRQALGRSRGGFGSKLHLRCDRRGRPMAFVLTPGERNERAALPELMAQGTVHRGGRGRPRIRPRTVVGDRGYMDRCLQSEADQRLGLRPTPPPPTAVGFCPLQVGRQPPGRARSQTRALQHQRLTVPCAERHVQSRARWQLVYHSIHSLPPPATMAIPVRARRSFRSLPWCCALVAFMAFGLTWRSAQLHTKLALRLFPRKQLGGTLLHG
jgi:hypothetical protein